MASKHTIKTLAEDVNTRFKTINNRLDIMQPQLQEMHDFIIDTRGFERGRASYKKDGSLNIDPRIFDVIKWALLIAALALGGAKWL